MVSDNDSGEPYIDWRIIWMSRLTADVPAAYPGGPSHKVGTPVFSSSTVRDTQGDVWGFVRPNPVSLALHTSIISAHEAVRLRRTIAFQNTATPWGGGKDVVLQNLPHLYDFFERCMVAVTFSMQALDTFCNFAFSYHVKGTVPVKIGKKEKRLNLQELQRSNISVKMKIGSILPKVLSIQSIESGNDAAWNNYLELERIRNTTVHLDSSKENPKNIDTKSLFHEFLGTDATVYPKWALDVMDYYKGNMKNSAFVDIARKELEGPGSSR